MSFGLFPRGVPAQKRLFDLILTIPLLIIAIPLMGLVAIALWISDGRPVLFCQPRPGLKARVFNLYKFRTMRHAVDRHGKLLPDSARITPLGRFLRASSLDELPELFQVLRGEMSLVGPRPLLVDYLPLYSPTQARRHEVLPGITGWAQINGRNLLSWEEKFDLDIWYVDHWSVGLDLKILVLTFWKAIKREGIHAPGSATSEVFTGSKLSTVERSTVESNHSSSPE